MSRTIFDGGAPLTTEERRARGVSAPPRPPSPSAAQSTVCAVVMSDPTGQLPEEVDLVISDDSVEVFRKGSRGDPVMVWPLTTILRWTTGETDIRLDLTSPAASIVFAVTSPAAVAAALLAKTTAAAERMRAGGGGGGGVVRRHSAAPSRAAAAPPPSAPSQARRLSQGHGPKAFPSTVVVDPSRSLPQHVTISVAGSGLRVTGVGSTVGFKWPLGDLTRWGAGGGAGGAVLSVWVKNPNGGPPVEFCFKTSFAAAIVSQLQTLTAQLAEVGRSTLISAAARPPAAPAAAAAPAPPAGVVMVACPKCSSQLAVPGGKGTKAMCPSCGQKFKL